MTLVTFSPFSKFAYIDANSLLVIIIVIIIITNCVVYVCRKWKKDGTQRIMVSRLTGAALWRMQLTVPYNTQVGAVPYQMIMKQCISSTFLFAVHWLSFSWHFFIASNSDYLNRRDATGDSKLSQAVAAKLEDGNVRAAVRLLMSDDLPAEPSTDNLIKLQEKHPQATVKAEDLPSTSVEKLARTFSVL